MTKQERSVLLLVLAVCFAGSVLQYGFKTYPRLSEQISLIESEHLIRKIDLNTATAEELRQIPFVGERRAERIVAFRAEEGGFSAPEQLKAVIGVGDKQFETLKAYVKTGEIVD